MGRYEFALHIVYSPQLVLEILIKIGISSQIWEETA